jgi:hypothetical protein
MNFIRFLILKVPVARLLAMFSFKDLNVPMDYAGSITEDIAHSQRFDSVRIQMALTPGRLMRHRTQSPRKAPKPGDLLAPVAARSLNDAACRWSPTG